MMSSDGDGHADAKVMQVCTSLLDAILLANEFTGDYRGSYELDGDCHSFQFSEEPSHSGGYEWVEIRPAPMADRKFVGQTNWMNSFQKALQTLSNS